MRPTARSSPTEPAVERKAGPACARGHRGPSDVRAVGAPVGPGADDRRSRPWGVGICRDRAAFGRGRSGADARMDANHGRPRSASISASIPRPPRRGSAEHAAADGYRGWRADQGVARWQRYSLCDRLQRACRGVCVLLPLLGASVLRRFLSLLAVERHQAQRFGSVVGNNHGCDGSRRSIPCPSKLAGGGGRGGRFSPPPPPPDPPPPRGGARGGGAGKPLAPPPPPPPEPDDASPGVARDDTR